MHGRKVWHHVVFELSRLAWCLVRDLSAMHIIAENAYDMHGRKVWHHAVLCALASPILFSLYKPNS